MIGIIGAIVGDLIGQSYEFHSTKDYYFELLTDKSHVTDDSTCTIAVADWLLHTNRTHDELIDKFKYWCNKYNNKCTIFFFQIDENAVPVFYINKATWTEEYKRIISLCAYNRKCYLIIEPDTQNKNRYCEITCM